MRAEPAETLHPPPDPLPGSEQLPAEHLPAEHLHAQDLAAYAPPDPADRVVRVPAAAAIIVGGVLLAIIAVGAIISLTEDRPLTGPAVAPPMPTKASLAVTYDRVSRQLSVAELSVTMPDEPFSCDVEPRSQPGLFSSTFACTAWVHVDYDDQQSDWVAATGLGVLDDRLRTGQDLNEIAQATMAAFAARNYDLDNVTIRKQQTEPLTGVAPEGKAVLASAELHIADQDLPTTYDRVLVAVFELGGGQHAVYFAVRPNDSRKNVTDALRQSAETVSARK